LCHALLGERRRRPVGDDAAKRAGPAEINKKRPLHSAAFYPWRGDYSFSSSSKVRASASRTRSSMALTGIAIPRSFSADSLLEPRWNQLPTSGVVLVPLVPAAPSSSGAVSEPYTSI